MHKRSVIRTEFIPPLLLYFAVAAIFLWLKQSTNTRLPSAVGDLVTQYYPTLKYGFAELRRGHLPLWNPYQLCGTPFLANLHQGFFYPFYAPFLLLSPELANDVHIVLHVILACLGTYLLCRHFRMHAAAALIAGLVYGYCGSMMINLYFPDFLTSSAWIPWLFLCADRTVLRPSARNTALLALVLGVSVLGGHGLQYLYFAFWGLLPLMLVRSALRLKYSGARALAASYGMLLLALVLGGMIGLVRALPFAEFVGQSWRAFGKEGQDSALTPVAPGVFREGLLTPVPGTSGPPLQGEQVSAVYVGAVALGLALYGVVCWRRRWIAVPIAVAGVIAALYSFGADGVVFPVMSKLPGGTLFRGINRVLIIFGLAVAVLCGAGLDEALWRGRHHLRPRRGWRWLGLPAAAVVFALGIVVTLGFVLGERRGWLALAVYGVLAAGLLVTIVRVRGGALRSAALAALAVLVFVDLFLAQQWGLPQLRGAYNRDAPLWADIRQRQGLDRTYILSTWGPQHPLRFFSGIAKAGLNYGIWMATDYETLCSRRFARYLESFGPSYFAPMCYVDFALSADNIQLAELMGIRFYVIPPELESSFFARLPEHASRWKLIQRYMRAGLYEYADPMPRTFIVPRVQVLPREEDILAELRTADLRAVAFVEEELEAPLPSTSAVQDGSGHAEIVEYVPNRVVIETKAPNGGLLVLTDQYDTGWEATIDGAPARIYRTNYLFRGVSIPAGTHRVEFRYRPTALLVGAAGSVTGLGMTLLLLVRSSGRTNRTTSRRTRRSSSRLAAGSP